MRAGISPCSGDRALPRARRAARKQSRIMEQSAERFYPRPSCAAGATARYARTADIAAGALIALYLLAGRWTPGRIAGTDFAGGLFEPRFWIVGILGALALLSEENADRDHRTRLRTLVAISLVALF